MCVCVYVCVCVCVLFMVKEPLILLHLVIEYCNLVLQPGSFSK